MAKHEKESFLEKQIREIENRLFYLGNIKDSLILFFIFSLLFMIIWIPQVLSLLLSHKINKFIGILNLFFLPISLILGISAIKQLNALIRENKKDLSIKKKEDKAEKEVQELLQKSLTEDFHIFPNIFTGYGDVDTVVIGPTGIYAIEVKSNEGTIAMDSNGYLTVIDGEKPKKNYRHQAIVGANMIKKILDSETGAKSFVQPVIVFPFASVVKDLVLASNKDPYKVPVLGKKELIEYIYSNKQNTTLSKDLIEKFSEVLKGFKTTEEEEQ